LRDDKAFRRELVEVLEHIGGQELLDKMAGYSMATWIPSSGTHAGLAGRIAAGGIFTTLFGVTPEALTIVASTSPKLVGELAINIGKAIRETKKGIEKTTGPRLFLNQFNKSEKTVMP